MLFSGGGGFSATPATKGIIQMKLCPFCSKEAFYVYNPSAGYRGGHGMEHWVGCQNNDCYIGWVGAASYTKKEAIDIWEKRQ